MDFKKTVKAELEDKYSQMLDSLTPVPYGKVPKVDNLQTYTTNRGKYYRRLETEKTEFNNACRTVKDRRDSRINAENRAKEARANSRFRRGQAIRTCIFFLPVLIALIVGLDVFNKTHGHIDAIDALNGLTLGWVIFFYVVFCLVSLISAIAFTVKMFSNESYNSYVEYKERGYKKAAVVVALLSVFIVALNVMQVVPNLSKNKIVLSGGDTNIIEYIEKGDTIVLPDGVKSDAIYNTYKTKYTFEGWLIDGVLYQPGEKFEPNGWITNAEAQFAQKDWCILSVSASNASISVSCNGQTLESQKEYEIPRGTQVTVTASFSYSDTSFSVGGNRVSSPYMFTLDKNTTAYASSSDPGCLVEGTMITLADGNTKAVEDLRMGDILAVFNHETGEYGYAPLLCNIHANLEADYYDIINLYFSDGTSLKIVDEHGLFDKDLNKYVYIDEENANDFIGHSFVSSTYHNGKIFSGIVTLDRVEYTNEYIKIFNPASVWHINLIADNMLTLSAGMVNLFEYDENMKYDETLMAQDIEKYGLYTYDDFKDYVSIEVFNAFPFKYYKVAIEKGLYTYEQVLGLIQLYNDLGSIK